MLCDVAEGPQNSQHHEDRAGQRLLEDTVRADGSDCLIGTEFPNGTVKNLDVDSGESRKIL